MMMERLLLASSWGGMTCRSLIFYLLFVPKSLAEVVMDSCGCFYGCWVGLGRGVVLCLINPLTPC